MKVNVGDRIRQARKGASAIAQRRCLPCRGQRGHAFAAQKLAEKVEELVAQLEFVHSQIEGVRRRVGRR